MNQKQIVFKYLIENPDKWISSDNLAYYLQSAITCNSRKAVINKLLNEAFQIDVGIQKAKGRGGKSCWRVDTALISVLQSHSDSLNSKSRKSSGSRKPRVKKVEKASIIQHENLYPLDKYLIIRKKKENDIGYLYGLSKKDGKVIVSCEYNLPRLLVDYKKFVKLNVLSSLGKLGNNLKEKI